MDSISNWTMFGVHVVSVALFEYEIEGEVSYNAHLTVSLDDNDSEPYEKVVTLISDHWDIDPVECAVHAAVSIGGLFSINGTITIWDQEEHFIGEFELPDDPFDYDSEDVEIKWSKSDTDEKDRPKQAGIFTIKYKD